MKKFLFFPIVLALTSAVALAQSPSPAESPAASPAKHKHAKKEASPAASESPAASPAAEKKKSSKKKEAAATSTETASSSTATTAASPAKKSFFQKIAEGPTAANANAPKTEKKGAEAMGTPAPGGGPGMVWVNTETKVYHQEGDRWYGRTKKGKYMKESDAIKEGYRAEKEGKKKES